MCTIIGIKFEDSKRVTATQFMKIATQIKVKGTDEFGYVIVLESKRGLIHKYIKKTGITSYYRYKDSILNDFRKFKSKIRAILIHSRATPEMESDITSIPQPYVTNNKYSIPYVLAAHGTIPDYQDLVYKYIDELNGSKFRSSKYEAEYIGMKSDLLKVDTEYLSLTDGLTEYIIKNTKGKLTTIALNLMTGGFYEELMTNRLGIWKQNFYGTMDVYANFNIKYSMNLDESNVSGLRNASINSRQYEYLENKYRNVNEVFVSFSGGMDIVASVMKYLNQLYYELPVHVIKERDIHFTLVYFDWGQVASKEEIKTMRKFKKYLVDCFPEISFHTKVIYLKEVFKLFGDLRLSNSETEGDILETEQSISYVNFRNSIFLNILAGYAEKMIMNKYGKAVPVDFIFGLNLSEGMIMPDNSYLWLENINKAIRCSGDYSQDFIVVAPFVHKTKTEIMKYLVSKPKLQKALEISYSCYYPDENGNPCGKCGSCILREKAFSRAQQFQKRKDFC